MLSPQQKSQVDALLDRLLDVPEGERLTELSRDPTSDPVVRAEVESVLRAAQSAGDFLVRKPTEPEMEPPGEMAVGSRLGVWRIVGRIGRGGMGEVFEARRTAGDFEQRAAIKVLQREAIAEQERFHFERRVLARLEHPGIARLLDGATMSDGRPYMVMEYVAGRQIIDYCNSTGASLETRLSLFAQVCDAVAYAHSHLIVHRDLKPSNILVTADGRVKLLDFGVAKLLGPLDSSVTLAAHHAPLTPLWAAPEQLLGKSVTTATDTFALGLLLFQLLTGTHPWPASSGMPIVQAARSILNRVAPRASDAAEASARRGVEPPVMPARIQGDLDAVVAKALREEPQQRYATVAELKLDVERFLRNDPVEARSGARLYVLGRLLRRYRLAAAGLAIVLLSLAVGIGVAGFQARRAALERDIARRDAAREEAVRYSLTRLFRAAITDQGDKPATARNMIDSSAQRVLSEYRDQPRLAGQLVLTLADLYGALEDVEGAGSLLEGFLADAVSADPAVIADARQKLANIEFLRGNVPHSSELLGQAERFWATAPQAYREERLEGLGIRAKIQRAQGDLEGAIRASRSAIAERIALSGKDNRETAVLYNSLAITLMSANRLQEALEAYRNTVSIYRAAGLENDLDTQVVLANIGTLELRIGHLDVAEQELKSAYEKERAIAGDSAAVAAAMGYYGRTLYIRNDSHRAVPVLQQAAAIATKYAGASSPVALQNAMFLGDAQLAAADSAGARATLSAARDTAAAQYGPTHVLTLRARLSLAAIAYPGGGPSEERKELRDVVGSLRSAGKQGVPYLAQALERLGTAELKGGDARAAIASLRECVALRESVGIQDWELGEARERLGEALAANGEQPASSTSLRQAEALLAAQLGATHPETVRARAALNR
ncbi:MAG TPA: serine/threonine-protein kinase [Steroidobacteraceae bacterium]